MTFLERARSYHGGCDPILADRCWPEILAVFEALEHVHDERYLEEILDAISALDKKAEEG